MKRIVLMGLLMAGCGLLPTEITGQGSGGGNAAGGGDSNAGGGAAATGGGTASNGGGTGGSTSQCGHAAPASNQASSTCPGTAALGVPTKIATGESRLGVAAAATGDLDGDGKLDFAVIVGDKLKLYFGNGDGTFGNTPVALHGLDDATNLNLEGPVAIADFNADGKLDVMAMAMVSGEDGYPAIWLNRGNHLFGNSNQDFSYRATSTIDTYSGGNMLVTDLNADGLPDLVSCAGDIEVFLSSCGGLSGGLKVTYNTGDGMYPLSNCMVTQLNDGDHIPDLVVQSNGQTSVLHGNGSGAFARESDYVAVADFATLADLNNDGMQDVVLENILGGSQNSGSITALLAQGDGSFLLEGNTWDLRGGGGYFPTLITGDINNDGKVDVLTMNFEPTLSVALGNGDGTFQAATQLGLTVDGQTFALFADFNHDGLPDVIATDGADINILMNSCH